MKHFLRILELEYDVFCKPVIAKDLVPVILWTSTLPVLLCVMYFDFFYFDFCRHIHVLENMQAVSFPCSLLTQQYNS